MKTPSSPTKVMKNPILSFQDEIAAMKGKKTDPDSEVKAMEKLKLDEQQVNEGESRGTLKDRLLNATPDQITLFAALFSKALDISHNECVVFLGPHNLAEKTSTSILDSEGGSPVPKSHQDVFDAPSFGLNKEEQLKALDTIKQAAEEIRARASVIWQVYDENGHFKPVPVETQDASANDDETRARWYAYSTRILIRRVAESAEDLIECRVACCGNVDAGKSTVLGVLTKGHLDDGRGRARVALFRHKHELETGRTSSVGMEIMGFDADGKEVLPEGALSALADKSLTQSNGELNLQSPTQPGIRKQQLSWDEICKRAAKLVSFIDLAGHERYLKTTIFGLTGCVPDFVLLVIGANAGLIGMCKEHLSVALALSVPVVCVVTKVDMTPPNVLEQTLKQLCKILRSPGCRKSPVFVKNEGMASELARGFVRERACPVFLVSNVTGDGLAPLRIFLNTLPAGLNGRYPVDDPLEFSISDVFSVPFVGTVVSGVILSGRIAVGDNVLLGPDSLGQFTPTAIKSMQRKRVNVDSAEAGQSVSFSLKRIRRNGVRKGMVIVGKVDGQPAPRAVKAFEAQVLILYHNSTLQPNYQSMLHVGSVRQTVKILTIESSRILRTGDRAKVNFEFIKSPEYIKVGEKILFREGKTKGLGVITKVGP